MPFLTIETNRPIPEAERPALLCQLSATLARLLGKPEAYVMVALRSNPNMLFAGSADPMAYLEVKSIGLPPARTGEFSAALCDLLGSALGLPPERIYIEFSDAPRQLWGWNRGTF